MKIDDVLVKNDLVGGFTSNDISKMRRAIIEYGKYKCKEQREICARKSWDAWEPEEYNNLDDSVRNAPEPKFD